jgi:hypothetical protein
LHQLRADLVLQFNLDSPWETLNFAHELACTLLEHGAKLSRYGCVVLNEGLGLVADLQFLLFVFEKFRILSEMLLDHFRILINVFLGQDSQ